MPIIRPKCTACAFATGRLPGRPRQTGQVCVFGGSPKDSSQPQNIFVRGLQLDVDLQADHGLVGGRSYRPPFTRPEVRVGSLIHARPDPSKPSPRSSA